MQEQARKECALQRVDRSCDWQALTRTQPGTASGRLDGVSSSHPRYVYVISGLGGDEASAVFETTVPDRTQRSPPEDDGVKFAGKD